jgi:hypothetical protein
LDEWDQEAIHGRAQAAGSVGPAIELLFSDMQRVSPTVPPAALGLAVVCAALLVPAATAAPPEIYPLSSVHRGQVGYGMTTFQGTTPERFEFEVIGVAHNFLPRQDLILVKSNDPKLQVTGFWRGMSGSPLYIEGKLACAFSYGWSFNKIAMGGCTPLEYMKREGLGTKRRSAPGALAPPSTMAQWKQLTATGSIEDLFGGPRQPWLFATPMPPRPAASTDDSLTAAVPLAMGGWNAEAFAMVEKLFAGYPLQPMRAGGAGSSVAGSAEGPTEFLMGASISVQLIRGDMSAAGTGTVSYVDGNRVLAFGHPMFQAGEIYAPVASAEVQTVVASAQFPFVMATPRRELGSLVQDRQSMIMADTKLKSVMIPVDIYVTSRGADGAKLETGEFHVEVLDDKFLTPALAGAAAANAVGHYFPDRDHVTAKIDSYVKIKGMGELRFTDYLYANDGAGSVIGGARGLRALGALAFNPFAPAKAERVELKVDLTFAADYGEVKRMRLATPTLKVGRNKATIVMDAPDGREVTEDVVFDVPASVAGALVQVEITAGDSARLDAAPPVDLPSLVSAFRTLLPGNVWAITVYIPEEGVAVDGKVIRDVPASVLDKLAPATRTPRAQPFKPMSRSIQPAKRVIGGGTSLLVRVEPLVK